MDNTRPLLTLNTDSNKYTTLVNLLHSYLVKVVHGLSIGALGIGATSPLDRKVLFLTGKGDKEIGYPECLCIPVSMRDITNIKGPSDAHL
eukprot:5363693-Ditylum_brightwellii.AAC.1